MSDLPTSLLSLPAVGDVTVARLRHKVRLVALKALLTASGETIAPRAATSLRALQAVIQDMVRTDKAGVLDAIGAPDVLNPLLVLAAGLRRSDHLLLQVVPSLMAALSTKPRAIPEAVLWEAPISVVPHPAEDCHFVFDPPAKALLVDPTGLSVECSDGTRIVLDAQARHDSLVVDRGFSRLGTADLRLHLSMHDGNPLSMEEAHPDKVGNAVSLGDRELDEWEAALNEALGLIEAALPEWYREIPVSLSRIIPVGFEPEMHLSASYREAPEVVYMTLHPDPLTMAEAIIHETQNSKCNLLCWMDPVLHNAYTAWTESPVRPDLRPLMGVLLAIHAFIPVSALHHRLAEMDHPVSRTQRFRDRRSQVLAGNAGGLAVVAAQADPTKAGRRLIDGLSALHEVLASAQPSESWAPDALPPA